MAALFAFLNDPGPTDGSGAGVPAAAAGEPDWPDADAWAGHCRSWRDRLAALPDLGSGLLEFVASKR